MSKEKQIEKDELQELVITLSDCQHKYDKEVNKAIITKSPMPKENKYYAKYLMEQGYRKQSEGEWGFDGMSWTCSECGEYATKGIKTDFCPNCGAKMKG